MVTNEITEINEQTNNLIELTIMDNVREDLKENPYILETIRVLKVGGYRSAIGSFWNAVIDDLRRKIMHRSLDLFNKEMNLSHKVEKYEDFQDYINDEILIDGAYKLGVIGWEAHKVLKHSKETRHIFDGHPQSSDPTPIKTLSMIEDCTKYVLNVDYPTQIVDITNYVALMETSDFDNNKINISNALGDLPEIYSNKLINIIFSKYISSDCSNIMKQNIETVAPILWPLLSSDCKNQVSKRVDTEISNCDKTKISNCFSFIKLVNAQRFLSNYSRKYLLSPYIEKLNNSLDIFNVENDCVEFLFDYAGFIPQDLIYQYVNGLTQTYVGKSGSSSLFSRTDFYADRAALKIPLMFEKFDIRSIDCFVECIKKNSVLKNRISYSNTKMKRLRTLGEILLSICNDDYSQIDFLKMLTTESNEKDFFMLIK